MSEQVFESMSDGGAGTDSAVDSSVAVSDHTDTYTRTDPGLDMSLNTGLSTGTGVGLSHGCDATSSCAAAVATEPTLASAGSTGSAGVADQASVLRTLVSRSARDIAERDADRADASRRGAGAAHRSAGHSGRGLAKTIAVASGKGGAGKSVLATNLASAAAYRGRRVLLVDADLGTANADVMCNVNPRVGLGHVIAGRCTMAEAIVPTCGGFDLLPGASGLAEVAALGLAERRLLMDRLRALEPAYELIVADCGAGLHPGVLSFVALADALWLVSTPEPTAVVDAYALLKAIRVKSIPCGRVGLVMNQARDERSGREAMDRLRRTASTYLGIDVEGLGIVPYDPSVSMSVTSRSPMLSGGNARHLNSPAARAILRLADRAVRDVGAGAY